MIIEDYRILYGNNKEISLAKNPDNGVNFYFAKKDELTGYKEGLTVFNMDYESLSELKTIIEKLLVNK